MTHIGTRRWSSVSWPRSFIVDPTTTPAITLPGSAFISRRVYPPPAEKPVAAYGAFTSSGCFVSMANCWSAACITL